MTGALHSVGFLDTCDGVLNYLPERRLDAMRDSRLGRHAVVGVLRCMQSAFQFWFRLFLLREVEAQRCLGSSRHICVRSIRPDGLGYRDLGPGSCPVSLGLDHQSAGWTYG